MEWWKTAFNQKYREEYKDFNLKTTPIIVNFLTTLLPIGSVLDIACGDGRISEELVNAGYSVTGLDYSKSQIDEAKKRKGKYIVGDMRDMPFKDEFDSIISIFTSFGYGSIEDDVKTLRCAYKALKENGLYILDYTQNKNDGEFHTVRNGNFTGKFRNYTSDVLKDMIEDVGFKVKEIYGTYSKKKYTTKTPRMIFVALKN